MEQGFKNMAARIVHAENNFIELLMEFGKIDKKLAEKVFQIYKKKKLIKLDSVNGKYTVKHGGYLDKDVIVNASKMNEEATTTTTTLSQGYHQDKIGKKKLIKRKSFKEIYKDELQERENPIKGGVGDNLEPSEVNKDELEMGIKIEMEHIGKNKKLSNEEKRKTAQDIALDHLKEKKNYYTLLKKYVENDSNIKESIYGKFKTFLLESDVKQQKQKALGLEHIAYNNYKDKNDIHYKWYEKIKDFEKVEEKDFHNNYKSIKEQSSKTKDSPHRGMLTKPRGGVWTKEKIVKELKIGGFSSSGKLNWLKEMKKYDNDNDILNHIFYHGTGGSIEKKLKPSIALNKKMFRGGGYDSDYYAISLSKSKDMASNFTGDQRSGTVYTVLLKKDAKVIDMPNIKDSNELDDIIEELWNHGVDAVKIGGDGGEQELSIINPSSIILGPSESVGVYQKKRFINDTIEDIQAINKSYSDRIEEINNSRKKENEQ